MTGRVVSFALALGIALLPHASAHAQTDPVSFYNQNVPIWSEASALSAGGLTDFNRFRVMSEPVFGELSVEVAYEHLLTLRQRGLSSARFPGSVPGGGEWLDLQWTIEEREHVLWRHRFDRLNVGWAPTDALEVTVGRQALSWATTLFLTPADPFAPFDPADPFREFRAGVDALRLKISPGPLSEIEIVARPTTTAAGEDMTALGRGLTTWQGWELSGWAGFLYGRPAGAVAAAGSLSATAVRGELSLREKGDDLVVRGTVGIDRLFNLLSRDLFLVAEYQHDGFGASDPDDYLALLVSEPFLRGEAQVLGRDETAIQVSYQLHPLWSVAVLWLANLNDGSSLVSPSFSYSAADEVTVAGGLFVGVGDDPATGVGGFPSEYGGVGTTGYLSVVVFF